MINQCLECGNDFTTYPSRIADGKGKYCSRKCSDKHTLLKKGVHHHSSTEFGAPGTHPHNFKGWRYAGRTHKYRLLFKPDHPDADTRGYIREHRYVVERVLGRRLTTIEEVHHIDGNGLNNAPENLRLMSSKAAHLRLEHALGTYDKHPERHSARKTRLH